MERYNTRQDDSQQLEIRVRKWFDQLNSVILPEEDLTIANLYARLKSLHNYLVNIGLCDLSRAPVVEKELNMSNEEVCKDLGLGQYHSLGMNSLSAKVIERSLTDPNASFEANVSLH
jgi:hypothetical protein